MVLTGSFELSLVTGLSCHHHPRDAERVFASLTPASGRQDHTTSPSASTPFASRHQNVHRIPVPTSVAIARAPLLRNRMRGSMQVIWLRAQAEHFLQAGWTWFCVICPAG